MRSKLLTTAMATASMLVLTQTGDAQAGGIKYKHKPQVRFDHVAPPPKIKPRLRVKVKKAAPKVRVKVANPNISPEQAGSAGTAKAAAKVERAGAKKKIAANAPVKKRHRFALLPETIALMPTRNPRKLERVDTPDDNRIARLDDAFLNRMSELEAARMTAQAAEAASEFIELGAVNAEMGLPTPDLGGGNKTNQDHLDAMFEDDTDGIAYSDAARFGPDNFNGLANTHARGPANANGTDAADAASGFWSVTAEKIAAGLENVDGKKPDQTDLHVVGQWTITYWGGGGRSATETTIKWSDGAIKVVRRDEYYNGSSSHAYFGTDRDGNWLEPDTNGDRIQVADPNSGNRVSDNESNKPGSDDPKDGIAELRDPDSGHAGPSPFPWIEDGSGPKTLRDLTDSAPVNVLTAGPGQDQQVKTGHTVPMVTQADLVERYDPDSTDRGGPRANPFDSPDPGGIPPGEGDL